LSAALSEMGLKVMQFGCDPKGDSTNIPRDGKYIPTVPDLKAAADEPGGGVKIAYVDVSCPI
jgi:nitrogenase subunit NifH